MLISQHRVLKMPSAQRHITAYDDFGWLTVKRYPIASDALLPSTGLNLLKEVAVKHHYDSHGAMYKLTNAINDNVYWELLSSEANGSLHKQRLGERNNSEGMFPINMGRGYDEMGRVISISTTARGKSLQDTGYVYDGFGNMDIRTNHAAANDALFDHEVFEYDSLNRLTKSTLSSSKGDPSLERSNGYDGHGNLLFKDKLSNEAA